MTLSQRVALAKDLFGKPESVAVTRVTGTATADSSDGTVTVELPDGTELELPTIGGVREGDEVTIHVQRGDAQVIAANGWGDAVQAAADEAQAVAQATGQHFWEDANGAHVTEVTRDEWEDSSGSSYQSGHNILINSLGILLRRALNYIAAWTGSAVSFYDGTGNAAANVTASFGSSGAQVGKSGESHIEMDYHSMKMVDKDGDAYLHISDLRDRTGTAPVSETFTSKGSTLYSLTYPANSTDYTVVVSDSSGGTVTKHTDSFEFSERPTTGAVITAEYITESTRAKAFTIGTRDGTPVGNGSVSIGVGSKATGLESVSIGGGLASGREAAAIGRSSSRGVSSFSCNMGDSSGEYSFAANSGAASGWNSSAFGEGTRAIGDDQMVVGYYNEPVLQYRFVVGCGSTQTIDGQSVMVPKNGFVVDQFGNTMASGAVAAADKLYMYNTALEDCFVTDEVTATIGSIAAGAAKWVNVATAKTGYKPLAVVGYYLNGANLLIPYCARLNGGNAQFALRNSASSASSASATIVAQVLYIKTTA